MSTGKREASFCVFISWIFFHVQVQFYKWKKNQYSKSNFCFLILDPIYFAVIFFTVYFAFDHICKYPAFTFHLYFHFPLPLALPFPPADQGNSLLILGNGHILCLSMTIWILSTIFILWICWTLHFAIGTFLAFKSQHPKCMYWKGRLSGLRHLTPSPTV